MCTWPFLSKPLHVCENLPPVLHVVSSVTCVLPGEPPQLRSCKQNMHTTWWDWVVRGQWSLALVICSQHAQSNRGRNLGPVRCGNNMTCCTHQWANAHALVKHNQSPLNIRSRHEQRQTRSSRSARKIVQSTPSIKEEQTRKGLLMGNI